MEINTHPAAPLCATASASAPEASPEALPGAPAREMNRRLFLALALGVLLLGAGVQFYLLHYRALYAISADESARTLLADEWRHAKGLQLHSWLPLPQVINGLALDLWPDLFRTPRLVTFAFGLLTLAALMGLAHALFKSRPLTLLTGLLGALFSHRVILSVVPLSENMYFFSVLAGCALFARWLERRRPWMILLAALALAFGNAVRYEAWIFSAILIAVVSVTCFVGERKTPLWVLPASAAIMFTFPAIWLAAFAIKWGEMFSFARITAGEYNYLYGNTWRSNWPRSVAVQFVKENGPQLNLLGLLSLGVLAWGCRRLRLWLLVPALAFVIFAIASLAGKAMPSHNFWRLPAVWSLMLIPFTAHALWQLGPAGRLRLPGGVWARRLTLGVAVLLFCGLFWRATLERSHTQMFTPFERAAGQYLYQQLGVVGAPKQGKVLIDTSNWGYIHIRVASQRPYMYILNSGLDARRQKAGLLTGQPDKDLAYLRANGVRYLVFTNPTLTRMLSRMPQLRLVKVFGNWGIWEVPG